MRIYSPDCNVCIGQIVKQVVGGPVLLKDYDYILTFLRRVHGTATSYETHKPDSASDNRELAGILRRSKQTPCIRSLDALVKLKVAAS